MRALFLAAIFLSTSYAQTYSVSVIQQPSGFSNLRMAAINSSGQAVGWGTTGATVQAFVSSASGVALLPTPQGLINPTPAAINDSGQVTGTVGVYPFYAYIATVSGSFVIPGIPNSNGRAINSSGHVAGGILPFYPTTVSEAFVATATDVQTVVQGPGGAPGAEAFWINDLGQFTGQYGQDAFIATGSNVTLLTAARAFFGQAATACINDAGEVVGVGTLPASYFFQAFVASSTTFSLIPLPAGATSAGVPLGCISSSGLVVGQSDLGGWTWTASAGTRLLNASVPAGWNISTPLGISKNGLILAQASYNGGPSQFVKLAAVLPPTTPAPSSSVLVGLGFLFLLAINSLMRRSDSRS